MSEITPGGILLVGCGKMGGALLGGVLGDERGAVRGGEAVRDDDGQRRDVAVHRVGGEVYNNHPRTATADEGRVGCDGESQAVEVDRQHVDHSVG